MGLPVVLDTCAFDPAHLWDALLRLPEVDLLEPLLES